MTKQKDTQEAPAITPEETEQFIGQARAAAQVDGSTISYLSQQLGAEAAKVGRLNGQVQLVQAQAQAERQRADHATQELVAAKQEVQRLQAKLDALPTAAAAEEKTPRTPRAS